MTDFSYEALTSDGTLQKGSLTAIDRAAAASEIEARGLVIVRLEKGTAGQDGSSLLKNPFRRTLSRNEVTILFNDLAALAQSRLRVDEALRLMLQELDLGNAKPLLTDMLRRLSSGESLSAAMNANLDVFDRLEVEMVRFAETSGDVGTALQQIAEDRELRDRIQAQIAGSLRYPAFLLLGSLVIMSFFLIYVIPQFETVLTSAQVDNSALSAVFGLSRGLNENSDLIMLVALVALVAGWVASKNAKVRLGFHKLLLRLPIVGGIAGAFRNSRICLLIAQTQKAGIELPVALAVIGPAVDGPGETAIGTDAVAGLRQGKRLSDVLATHANLQQLALRMIKIGEESSQVEAMARRAATLYEARAQRQLTRLIAIIGPATLIFISAVIGGMIVLIMSALLSINDLIAL